MITLHFFISTLFVGQLVERTFFDKPSENWNVLNFLRRTQKSSGRHARFSKGRLRDVPKRGLTKLCGRLLYGKQNSYFLSVHN